MRPLLRLATFAALLTFLPLNAYAQTNPIFARPFEYTDRDGAGTLTFTPVGDVGTGVGFQRLQAVLEQGTRRFSGSGVYHASNQDGGILPAPTLLAFTLLDSFGRGYFFEGSVQTGVETGNVGQGTYFPVNSPQTVVAWRIQSQGGGTPGGDPIVSSQPVLRQGWQQNTSSEAIGGVYYATYNTNRGVVSTATWSGTLPAAGRYKVEAFIPAAPTGRVPRTAAATYQLSGGDPTFQAVVQRASQVVTTSQWVDLGTHNFGANFQVVLTDETGEPAFSRSVVANAVRLTPVQ